MSTIAQLRDQVQGTPQAASLDYLLAQTHDARLEAVQKAVDYACNELELHKDQKQGLEENALSTEICSMLTMAGFEASRESSVGGHCDILIKGKDLFLWIAETKKHSNYAWLDKGFAQLSTRYSTGVPGQDNGEILIYCYVKDAKEMLEKWRAELVSRNEGVETMPAKCGSPLIFRSAHKHAASGLNFYVRHKAITLLWDPKDK